MNDNTLLWTLFDSSGGVCCTFKLRSTHCPEVTPLPPRDLRFRGTSSLDIFYAERVRTEAGPALEGSRALVSSFQSPQPAPERSPGMKISISELSGVRRAPVTVGSVTDEGIAARRRSR